MPVQSYEKMADEISRRCSWGLKAPSVEEAVRNAGVLTNAVSLLVRLNQRLKWLCDSYEREAIVEQDSAARLRDMLRLELRSGNCPEPLRSILLSDAGASHIRPPDENSDARTPYVRWRRRRVRKSHKPGAKK